MGLEIEAFCRVDRSHRLQRQALPADIAGAAEAVKGQSELDAVVAYLQMLGTAVK